MYVCMYVCMYVFMRAEGEESTSRGVGRGRGKGEADSPLSRMPNNRAQSQDPGIMTWAKGRCLVTELPRHPLFSLLFISFCSYSWFYYFYHLTFILSIEGIDLLPLLYVHFYQWHFSYCNFLLLFFLNVFSCERSVLLIFRSFPGLFTLMWGLSRWVCGTRWG